MNTYIYIYISKTMHIIYIYYIYNALFSHIFLEKAHGFDPPGQPGPGPQDRPFLEGEDRAARATFPHTSNGLRGGRKGAVIYIDIHNISIYCVHKYIYISLGVNVYMAFFVVML
jgi:hypothetical protein